MAIQAMTLRQIIDEADVLVPNSINEENKLKWLNEINAYFFEVVKIPKIAFFNVVANQVTVALTNVAIALRNIDRVMVGTSVYRSLQLEDVPPGNYGFVFGEPTDLTLDPAPSVVAKGYIRYMQHAQTTFTLPVGNVQTPEAPREYHEVYLLGLCEKIAKAMDDVVKANNYGSDYRGKLLIAQQNYVKTGAANP